MTVSVEHLTRELSTLVAVLCEHLNRHQSGPPVASNDVISSRWLEQLKHAVAAKGGRRLQQQGGAESAEESDTPGTHDAAATSTPGAGHTATSSALSMSDTYRSLFAEEAQGIHELSKQLEANSHAQHLAAVISQLYHRAMKRVKQAQDAVAPITTLELRQIKAGCKSLKLGAWRCGTSVYSACCCCNKV